MLSWFKVSADISSLEIIKGNRVIALMSITIDNALVNLGATIVMGFIICPVLF